MNKMYSLFIAVAISCLGSPAFAGQASIPNTFSSGTPAVASEVNANFSGMKTAINDNDARIATLESTIATLQSTITTLQSQLASINGSQVMALESYLTVDTTTDSRGPQVRLSGVNLQIVNGTGTTDGTPNGLGNLIIGYDRVRTDMNQTFCSDGTYTTQLNCESNGGIWGINLKSGSHYIIVGDDNNYTQYGGIVNGTLNTSNSPYASVLGGIYNTASGINSSVSGGYDNTASGGVSSVSGGQARTASGLYNWAGGSLLESH